MAQAEDAGIVYELEEAPKYGYPSSMTQISKKLKKVIDLAVEEYKG